MEEEVEQEAVGEIAWERRGQQWYKHCLLPTARLQLPENHTAAVAAMLVTTGTNFRALRNLKLKFHKIKHVFFLYFASSLTVIS